MLEKSKSVLTIAGSDSSGGAGIQADIKTISATGSYAASVITALTAQNTLGVHAIQAVSADFVRLQLQAVLTDLSINAIKIGMLHNRDIIDVVSVIIQQFKPENIVLDPVMFSKNNCALLDSDIILYLANQLFHQVTLITPNISEAEKLTGSIIKSNQDQEAAAQQIGSQYGVNVLIKGGHMKDAFSSDVVYLYQKKELKWFSAERICSRNTHGTGCSLSSAIASYLSQGYLLIKAIDSAKQYLTKTIEAARYTALGSGYGPVNHFYFLENNPNV